MNTIITDNAIILNFEPVEDKPGYYWTNKRNYLMASEEVLRKAFKGHENCNELFLSDKKF